LNSSLAQLAEELGCW